MILPPNHSPPIRTYLSRNPLSRNPEQNLLQKIGAFTAGMVAILSVATDVPAVCRAKDNVKYQQLTVR